MFYYSKLCPFSIPFSFDHMKSSSWITFLHHGGECLSQNTIDKLTVLKTKLRVNRFHEGISSNVRVFIVFLYMVHRVT